MPLHRQPGMLASNRSLSRSKMSLGSPEQDLLERQITLARPLLLVLSLLTVLEREPPSVRRYAIWCGAAYLAIALVEAAVELCGRQVKFRLPLSVDLAALAIFLVLSNSVAGFWFFFVFCVFAAAARGKSRGMLAALIAIGALGAAAGRIVLDPSPSHNLLHATAVCLGSAALGAGIGYLGSRERHQMLRRQFLEKVIGQVKFERGLSESIRQALGELVLAFECEQACLAIREEDLERLFVWKVHPSDRDPLAPETHPLAHSETYLADCLEVTLCWNSLEGEGEGFGWDRRTGEAYKILPQPPASTREELDARALLAASIETSGRPGGRILLVNPRRRMKPADLRWFELVVRHMDVPLENVFLLRHLRTRAVDAERSRISRDLHDGILQTLLSLQIQLDVLRRKLPRVAQNVGADLAALRKTLRQESEELRRMVNDLRPLRVESADLRELMSGFAERFQNESGMVVDLFLANGDVRAPDHVCREIFQIYRESLNNVKKHAHASHVVVKLGQDEARVSLVVDDNGLGFSFSGRFSSEELDRLRLGPISIKERTRSVGGTLTVESNPGHGARLTVEIPLS